MLKFEKFRIFSDDISLQNYLYEVVKHDATTNLYMHYDLSGTEFVIRGKDASYDWLVNELTKRNIGFITSETRLFSKEEMKKADFLKVSLMNPWELKGKSAKFFGTIYEENTGCDRCGCNQKIIPPLYVNKTTLQKKTNPTIADPKWNFLMIPPHEIFISEAFLEKFHKSNFSGLIIMERVEDYKGREMPAFYRVEIDSILPPLSLKSELYYETRCQECKTIISFMNSEMIYDKKHISQFKDFNFTNEIFGDKMPRVIVSQKAYRELELLKICPESDVEPIFFA